MRTLLQRPKAAQRTEPAKSTIRGRTRFGYGPEVDSILHLQRTIGNQAVQRLLENNAEERNARLTGTASPHLGHDFSRVPIGSPHRERFRRNSQSTCLGINMSRRQIAFPIR